MNSSSLKLDLCSATISLSTFPINRYQVAHSTAELQVESISPVLGYFLI